jgi:tRNA pseudouridine55 synthase
MPKNNILNIYKPLGISPLKAIERFKNLHKEYKDLKATYAGRLDPMAEGVLLVLAGEKTKEKDEYLKLDKEYEAEILFGFETDTYDILGLLKNAKHPMFGVLKAKIKKELKKFLGKQIFSFPPFSSYKIKGKPLFAWARQGRLNEVIIPEQSVEIHNIELLDVYGIKAFELFDVIKQKTALVKGDFRQKEVLGRWRKILDKKEKAYQIARLIINCSSGTYVRTIANELGKKLKTGATLYSLKRTRVGEFDYRNSLKI